MGIVPTRFGGKVSLKLHISEARVERHTPPLRAGDAESRERSDNPDKKFITILPLSK